MIRLLSCLLWVSALSEAALVKLNGVDKVPYGVYVFRNTWGCEIKDPRCGMGITHSLEDNSVYLTGDEELEARWEVFPVPNTDEYHIKALMECAPDFNNVDDSMCRALLSHEEGYAIVSHDFPIKWSIKKNPDTGMSGWLLESSTEGPFKGYRLSFDSESDFDLKLLPEDMYFELHLDTDFIVEQKFDMVNYDLPSGLQIVSTETFEIGSKNYNNPADKQVEMNVELAYDLVEVRHFMNWNGFVTNFPTTYMINDTIYNGETLAVAEKLNFQAPFGEQIVDVSPYQMSDVVSIPADSHRTISLSGTKVVFNVPFSGQVMTRYATKMHFFTQMINGKLYGESVYGVMTNIGDPMLNKQEGANVQPESGM